uniref:Uncharacterized protein n=1 Tax=Vitis vinifera TaxID=29760 RepID=F6HP41_VITVI
MVDVESGSCRWPPAVPLRGLAGRDGMGQYPNLLLV